MSCYQISVFINLIMKSLGITDPTKFTSPSGILKLKNRTGKSKTEQHKMESSKLMELCFDGITCEEALPNNKSKKSHFLGITDGLASEGQTSYVNHQKTAGTGKAMAEVIIQTIEETGSKNSVVSSRSDNTPANSSPDVRAHRFVEVYVERPLQRPYCLYHMAERPFRNLLEHFDGKTVGPLGTSGPIGKAMQL